MKKSQIYLRAAETIDRRLEDYSCIAVAVNFEEYDGCDSWDIETVRDYVKIFADHATAMQNLIEVGNPNSREIRVMMLCLASAIAASEGL